MTSNNPLNQPNTNGGINISKGLKNAPKMGPGSLVVDTYLNMRAGDDFGTSVFKASGTAMLWASAPAVMGAHFAGTLAIGGATGYSQWKNRATDNYRKQMYQGTVGGNYMDNNRALTMRQAAVQAIQGSKLNARSALGGEAKIFTNNMHRSY